MSPWNDIFHPWFDLRGHQNAGACSGITERWLLLWNPWTLNRDRHHDETGAELVTAMMMLMIGIIYGQYLRICMIRWLFICHELNPRVTLGDVFHCIRGELNRTKSTTEIITSVKTNPMTFHGISPNQIRRASHTRLVLMIMADFLYDQGWKLSLKGNSHNISIREYCFNNYQQENKDEF